MWNYSTPGIPDIFFERDEAVPITKEEVRAIVISKLRLAHGSSAIDIGCGSGSITVELCLQTLSDNIYAIDHNPKAIQLTERNLSKFGRNAKLLSGEAKDIIGHLPKVDAIVIGGSGGDLDTILRLSIDKLKAGGRLVIDTILIETMYAALNIIYKLALSEIDITQVIIHKGKKISTGTMLISRNPVLIISATKSDQ